MDFIKVILIHVVILCSHSCPAPLPVLYPPCSSCFSELFFFHCICVCGYMRVTVHSCRSESKHWESVLLPLGNESRRSDVATSAFTG